MGLRTLQSLNFQICSTLNHSKHKKAKIPCYIVESQVVTFDFKILSELIIY